MSSLRKASVDWLNARMRKKLDAIGFSPVKRAAPADQEHVEQVALFDWAKIMQKRYPELKWMFAIPNGSYRDPRTAARLKEEGVKAGVLDIFLPAARAGHHGLFIEMKAGRNRPTEKQSECATDLENEGYACYVCYSCSKAINVIEAYLLGNPLNGRTHK